MSALAMKYELAPTQISKWKKEFVAGANQIFDRGPVSQKSEAEIERDRLLRIIGELIDKPKKIGTENAKVELIYTIHFSLQNFCFIVIEFNFN